VSEEDRKKKKDRQKRETERVFDQFTVPFTQFPIANPQSKRSHTSRFLQNSNHEAIELWCIMSRMRYVTLEATAQ
jgi:hypothetical protein